MNKVILIGNLTKDPVSTETQSGVPMCRFSLAVNRTYGEGVDYFNVTAWRGQAENCARYLAKGRKVCVSGEIQTREYEDRNGNKQRATEIIAQEVEFLSPRETRQDEQQRPAERRTEPRQGRIADLQEIADNDLPF